MKKCATTPTTCLRGVTQVEALKESYVEVSNNKPSAREHPHQSSISSVYEKYVDLRFLSREKASYPGRPLIFVSVSGKNECTSSKYRHRSRQQFSQVFFLAHCVLKRTVRRWERILSQSQKKKRSKLLWNTICEKRISFPNRKCVKAIAVSRTHERRKELAETLRGKKFRVLIRNTKPSF